MLRKLGCGVASLAIIVPSAVSALSVEDYTLNSYLSQPLDLQIKLADLKGLNENDIRVKLATPEEFEAAGIEYDALHNNLNFDTNVAADGTGIVRVTTKQPLSEPFISFLVEYKWPSGRLMREYNLLLDPPTYRTNDAVSVSTPAAEAPPKSPAANAASSPSSTASEKSPTRASGQEHRVSTTDTLWDIAAKNRPDSSISVQQMMVAIQELNPSAFIDGNINLVKEGAVLRLPSAEDVRQVTTRAAMAEVATQNRQWQQMLESKGLSPEPTVKPLDGKEVVDTKDEGQGQEGATDSGRVTLVAADDNVASSEEQSAAGSDSVVLNENMSRLQRENSELSDRLKDLEEQLTLSEELLTLRSQQIAELENKLRELNETAVDELDDEFLAAVEKLEQEQQALVEETAAVQQTDAESSVLEEDAEQESAAADDGETVATDDDSASPNKETEKAEDKPELSEDHAEASEEEKAETEPVVPVVAPEPYEEPGFFASLLENTALVFGLVALLLLALALIVVRVIKGRKEQEAALLPLEEEADDDLADDAFHFDETEAPSIEELAAEAKALIDSEQYDAAVPVLRNAINHDPSRTALRKSLLFALYQTNESAYQQEVVAVRGTNEELDAYIAGLAHEGEDTAVADALSLDDLEDDLKLDDSSVSEPSLDDEFASVDQSDELDFDFSEPESQEALSESDFSFDLETPLETEATTEDEGFLDDFDFSFDDVDDTTKNDEAEKEGSDSEFSFDLDDEVGLGTLELDSDLSLEADEESFTEGVSSFVSDEGHQEESEELPTLDLDEEEFSLDGLSLEEHETVDDAPTSVETEGEDEASYDVKAAHEELDLSELSEEPLLEAEEDSFSFDDITLDELDGSEEESSFDLTELVVEEEGSQASEVETSELLDDTPEESAQTEGVFVGEDDDQVDSLLAELEGFDESLEDDDLSTELERELEQLGLSDSQDKEPEIEVAPETPAVASVEEEEQQFLDPEADSDPVDTRLNLARAFLDMGDEDIARETLMEVISEGNDAQKTSAQAMLDELDA